MKVPQSKIYLRCGGCSFAVLPVLSKTSLPRQWLNQEGGDWVSLSSKAQSPMEVYQQTRQQQTLNYIDGLQRRAKTNKHSTKRWTVFLLPSS